MLFVNQNLTNFISQCNQVIKELDIVNPPETMVDCPAEDSSTDSSTDSSSEDSSAVFDVSLASVLPSGFLPSVRNLQYEAEHINQVLVEKGFFSQINYRPHRPICTQYIGSYLKRTENKDPNFFAACFTKKALNCVRREIQFMRKDARLLQKQTTKSHYTPSPPSGNCNFNWTSGIHASL